MWNLMHCWDPDGEFTLASPILNTSKWRKRIGVTLTGVRALLLGEGGLVFLCGLFFPLPLPSSFPPLPNECTIVLDSWFLIYQVHHGKKLENYLRRLKNNTNRLNKRTKLWLRQLQTPCKAKGPHPHLLHLYTHHPKPGGHAQISLQQFRHVRKLVFHWYVAPAKSPQGQPALNHLWPLSRQRLRP